MANGNVLSAREVFGLKQRRVEALDMDGQADLFAEDGVLEIAFAPPGVPNRIQGREAIRAVTVGAVAGATSGTRRMVGHHSEVVHETADPEVIVAEFFAQTEDTVTGERFEARYIQVLRIRDGEIHSFRDYCTVEALTTLWGAPGENAIRSIRDEGLPSADG
ncbi:nuclear transport factor 2 family protein [Kitasatospora sp. NPDC051170]|uniref:nuclear transport factor 2 family protein n=1 Tax=Kitasatospora sp. NPDC051170 TaxID=3364056 RepID=UPI0037B7729B